MLLITEMAHFQSSQFPGGQSCRRLSGRSKPSANAASIRPYKTSAREQGRASAPRHLLVAQGPANRADESRPPSGAPGSRPEANWMRRPQLRGRTGPSRGTALVPLPRAPVDRSAAPSLVTVP